MAHINRDTFNVHRRLRMGDGWPEERKIQTTATAAAAQFWKSFVCKTIHKLRKKECDAICMRQKHLCDHSVHIKCHCTLLSRVHVVPMRENGEIQNMQTFAKRKLLSNIKTYRKYLNVSLSSLENEHQNICKQFLFVQ